MSKRKILQILDAKPGYYARYAQNDNEKDSKEKIVDLSPIALWALVEVEEVEERDEKDTDVQPMTLFDYMDFADNCHNYEGIHYYPSLIDTWKKDSFYTIDEDDIPQPAHNKRQK